MPDVRYRTTIDASFHQVAELLADKVEKPRKYIGGIVHSTILERGEDYVLREYVQGFPTQLTVRERITEHDVPGGRDYVFAHVDNAAYTGAFHNVLTRVEGQDDQVELEYHMDWQPRPGTHEEMPDEVARQIVTSGVEHMKRLAEHPVEVPEWVREFFDAVDSLKVEAMEPLLADNCRFRLGNGAEVVGKAAVLDANRGVTKVFSGLQHDYVSVDVTADGNRAYADCFVDYTTLAGGRYLIPFLTRLERTDGKISSVAAYGDASPIRHGW